MDTNQIKSLLSLALTAAREDEAAAYGEAGSMELGTRLFAAENAEEAVVKALDTFTTELIARANAAGQAAAHAGQDAAAATEARGMDKLTHSAVPASHPGFDEVGQAATVGALYLTTEAGEYSVTVRNGALVVEVVGRGHITITPKSTAGIIISTAK